MRHLLSVLVASSALFACVSETTVDLDASAPRDSGNSDSTMGMMDSSMGPDTGGMDSGGMDSGGGMDGGADAAMEAEAGPPSTTCIDQTYIMGAYNHLCSANPTTVVPGGTFAIGNYLNSQAWQMPYCPINYLIGYASVYQDNGALFFRYYVQRKTSTNDPNPVVVKGTFWIKSNPGNGPIELEEVCDLQNKGKVKTGTLAVSGAKFTLTWANNAGQETWDKQ